LVTSRLRLAAATVRAHTGIDPQLLSARSLRPGGATALLCAGIDPDVIQLLGRWKSDAMLRYLRVAAHAHSAPLAQRMLDAGAYSFAPNTYTPNHIQPIPEFIILNNLRVLSLTKKDFFDILDGAKIVVKNDSGSYNLQVVKNK
jgi:hypothetical protein